MAGNLPAIITTKPLQLWQKPFIRRILAGIKLLQKQMLPVPVKKTQIASARMARRGPGILIVIEFEIRRRQF